MKNNCLFFYDVFIADGGNKKDAKLWRLIFAPMDRESFQLMKQEPSFKVPLESYKRGLELPIVVSSEFRKPTKHKRSSLATISSLSDMDPPLAKKKKRIHDRLKSLVSSCENEEEIGAINFNGEVKKILGDRTN